MENSKIQPTSVRLKADLYAKSKMMQRKNGEASQGKLNTCYYSIMRCESSCCDKEARKRYG